MPGKKSKSLEEQFEELKKNFNMMAKMVKDKKTREKAVKKEVKNPVKKPTVARKQSIENIPIELSREEFTRLRDQTKIVMQEKAEKRQERQLTRTIEGAQPRPLNKYQQFIKDTIASLKELEPETPTKEHFWSAVNMWKVHKKTFEK